MVLPFDKIHPLIKTKTGLDIVRAGQDQESLELPYIQYDMKSDERYKDYQILKEYSEAVPGTPEIEYKNPVNALYEYATVNDPSDILAAMTLIRTLYNFLTTDAFKLSMNSTAINVKFTIMSAITEIKIIKSNFNERWLKFDVMYRFADVFKEAEGTFIETVDPRPTPVIDPGP